MKFKSTIFLFSAFTLGTSSGQIFLWNDNANGQVLQPVCDVPGPQGSFAIFAPNNDNWSWNGDVVLNLCTGLDLARPGNWAGGSLPQEGSTVSLGFLTGGSGSNTVADIDFNIDRLLIGSNNSLEIPTGTRTVTDEIINRGSMTMGAANLTSSVLSFENNFTLEENGSFSFTTINNNSVESTNAAGVLTVGENATISGVTGSFRTDIVNNGLIFQSGLSSAGLIFDGDFTVTNNGVIESPIPLSASSRGFIQFNGTTVENAAGSIQVAGEVQLGGATVRGGLISGAGVVAVTDNLESSLHGPMELAEGLNVVVGLNDILALTGEIENEADILLNGNISNPTNPPRLIIDGDTALNGRGSVIFSPVGIDIIESRESDDVLTIGVDQQVGGGRGSFLAGFLNNGRVFSNASELILAGESKINRALIEVEADGLMSIDEIAIENSEGMIQVDGELELEGATINQGSLTGAGFVEVTGNMESTINGPMVIGEGLDFSWNSFDTLTLSGTISNDGDFFLRAGTSRLTDGATIQVSGDATLEGNGSINFDSIFAANYIVSENPGDVLTLSLGQELNVNRGTIHADFVNNDLVEVTGSFLAFDVGQKTNNGTWRVLVDDFGSSEIEVSNADAILTNYDSSNGTLTGGRWEVVWDSTNSSFATLDLQGACIETIAPSTEVVLSGSRARFPALDCLEEIAGFLSLRDGQVLTVDQSLAISGELEIGLDDDFTATQLVVNGDVDFTGAVIDILDFGAVNGIYEVVSWTGTAIGVPTLQNVPPGLGAVVSADGDSLNLEISGAEPPELIDIVRNVNTGLVTIAYQSVDGVVYGVEGSEGLETFDIELPDTVVGDGSVLEYEHTLDVNTDKFFYRFFRRTDG